MKKLVKRTETNKFRITIEAYGCGDPCTCDCRGKSGGTAGGEPDGSGSPSIRK